MRFLHTITLSANDALVPIDRIKYINCSQREYGFEIKIASDDGDWIELFDNLKDASKRFNQIKKIVE